ncbi:PAS domain-containing protein [Clostridium saccharobutylicum]|uniref:PAS domain-containing protein n=1 Tax=Clostridium saccharobutylicum TaxID=169679 RepID=UPI00149429D2|nr:PAS domain-containing protein [Clostridium saccharobutylicum]NOV80116.1 PAS domain S-box-containing protein [Clostridium saccharobutylicum]NOW10186.1 PAS domain S-box-containing protein [Clostridium saccharobutylicum]
MIEKKIIDRKNYFLSATLSSIGDGVLATNLSGNITFFNKAAEEITGWAIEEVIGKSFQNIFTLVDINTKKALEDPINNVLEFYISTGLDENSALITKNKEIKYISATISPIKDDNGIVLGSVTVFKDITKIRSMVLKNKEEQSDFIRLFNSAPVGAIVLDENSVISKINEVASEFLDSNNILRIGKKFGDALGCEESFTNEQGCRYGSQCNNCDIKKATYLALNAGLSTNNIEFSRVFNINGMKKKLWFKASVTPVIQENKKNVAIAFIDITDRKKQKMK